MRIRTLECFRKAGNSRSGFTLIELLVVLSIAATIGAMVGPNLWQSFQRANERLLVINYAHDVTAIRRDLTESKRSVSVGQDELTMAGSGLGLPEMPAGWSIVANTEIYFLPTGVTNGGQIAFESPTGRAWRLNLGVLDGKVGVELQ